MRKERGGKKNVDEAWNVLSTKKKFYMVNDCGVLEIPLSGVIWGTKKNGKKV